MFIIIGGDGKEYGPVSAEQVRTWLANGRANLSTKAKYAGTEDWHTLGEYTEFVSQQGGDRAGASPPVVSPPANLAGRGVRLGSRCIDWAFSILSVVPGMVMVGGTIVRLAVRAAQGHQPDFSNGDAAKTGIGFIVLAAGWLAVLIVQIVLLSTRGQSIGKCITGLRIVCVADGSQAGFLRGWFLRECLMTVIGVVLVILPFFGILLRPAFHLTDWCMIFRDDQRCLHDLIAGTQVVRVNPNKMP